VALGAAAGAPLIFPNQPLFPGFSAVEPARDFDRGLFVTSAIADVPPMVVARRVGEDWLAAEFVRERTGVKPVRTDCSARRNRGVDTSVLGTLSDVNGCGGRSSHSSKSSGARRFFPAEDDDGSSWAGSIGGETRLDSGVRALKTDDCDDLASGVFGLTSAEGPETTLDKAFGVEEEL